LRSRSRREVRKEKAGGRKPIPEKFKEERESKAKQVVPKGENQRKLIAALKCDVVVLATGSAGTGKTFITSVIAANKYVQQEIDKIVLTRPYVGMGKSSGFWPGTIREKIEPYLRPVLDVLKDRIGANDFESLIGKSIELQPLEAVRGRTFDNAMVIIDEAQNTTPEEVRALVTRIGQNTQMVFCGDTSQSDIRGDNGLKYLTKIIEDNNLEGCSVIHFKPEDSVRSDICAVFVKIFDNEGRN
jgi:phosphate starvation-inducible PhoH-like protein